MAPKAAQKAAQKKAAKQKKILMLLAVPAVGALFYAYTTFSSLGKKPQPVDATPAAATTPAGSVPTPGTPVTPGVAQQPIGSLSSFISLGRKDPFNDHGPHAKTDPGKTGKNGGSPKGGGKDSGNGKTKQPQVPLTGAVISINGTKLALAIGSKFGHAPGLSGVSLFRLVKVTPRSALISVVGTTQQFTLHVLAPLTLEQNGGWRYTLILQPLGSAAPMTTVQDTSTNPGS